MSGPLYGQSTIIFSFKTEQHIALIINLRVIGSSPTFGLSAYSGKLVGVPAFNWIPCELNRM